MMYFFIILIIIIAVLLILVVLAQDSKGGGLTGDMGAASSSMMGARRASSWIENATWILIISLAVLSIGVNVFIPNDKTANVQTSSSIESAQEMPAPTTLPAQETPAETAPAPADAE
ncbi:preprotein translocase subunit SecG [Flammeovirga kamogawensis]|uniref:Protein-export membrane protein SecG n=1 Tax=Flammeovirga kamogawensis TaxID=373891 RepID=A0ABX8GWX9_9BACT|nr:preprotein translocase subunit SecG [Flammeovirga kamogawensis]MBB6461057.1 preprotein translocase subunit SecG [Flammeovirga kamogawensis]QWG07627.1 preprotein translocase subunit SecG [Flammeovirga kamogawensis]TRX69437.1 preprotein translocase subunit SecG [Flammeovirga kamogawensis]